MNLIQYFEEQHKERMKKMAAYLEKFITSQLPHLLKDDQIGNWKSLDVLYHLPRVERLYRDIEIENHTYRIYLHVIHPVDDPSKCLFHYHPWGSVTKIIEGGYWMGTGYGDPKGPTPRESHRIWMPAGSICEMIDPYGWHYVQPDGHESLSIMMTDQPWPKEFLPESNHDLSPNKPMGPQQVSAQMKRFLTLINK